ncbi:MAG: hypothetical protein L3J83_08470 [Proteobacteria bacterium]|nr:hypothetical protein [Pseudomonadota bacterium]
MIKVKTKRFWTYPWTFFGLYYYFGSPGDLVRFIAALEAALKNKIATDFKDFEFEQGKSYDALYVMNEIANAWGLLVH